MPYKDKELKKRYQQRIATPYMREWREKNREHLRKYSREWMKKRRQSVVKKEKDKQAPGAKMQAEMSKAKWRGRVAGLDDKYIIGLLIRRGNMTKEAITPEIIKLHRRQLIIKRKLRQYDNISN